MVSGHDQFARLGPYLVTADQVDPDNLKIECRLNGESRQSSRTDDFIFNGAQIVSYISRPHGSASGRHHFHRHA
jgi:2-keto-4-pentenoate hydratase/2-oxohepta-3-ene-1,7-dioic acid hydratase in catechol pathway